MPLRPLPLLALLLLTLAIPAWGSSGTATVGQTVTFSVTVAGTRPFSYQWRKEGAPIPGGTGETYQIVNVTLADAGRYSVVVTNAAGVATSDDVELTVKPAPPGSLVVHVVIATPPPPPPESSLGPPPKTSPSL